MKNIKSFRNSVLAVCALMLLVINLNAAAVSEIILRSATGAALPEEFIRANMNTRVGSEFNPRVLSEDIKRLSGQGTLADVEAQAAEKADGTVAITLNISLQPSVRSIVFEGNTIFSERRLHQAVEQLSGAPLDERRVSNDTLAISKLYSNRGYKGTQVEHLIQEIPGTNEVNVIFRIQEEMRAKLRPVQFTGNTVFSNRQLRRAITSKSTFWSRIFRVGYFDQSKLPDDRDLLTELYTGRGYLDFQTEGVERSLSANRKWITVEFKLNEGQPYNVSSVSFSGNQRFSTAELEPLVQLKPGTVYNSATESADISRIRGKYEPLGYVDISVYAVHNRDSRNHSVTIEYRISEGDIATIRDLLISGNKVTKDHVIRREMALHPDDLADAGKIRTSKNILQNMNYFEKVEVVPAATEEADKRDLLVNVQEKRTGQLMLGAGFSSEDSVSGWIEISQANFDWREWPRFTGGGQRMRARASIGTELNEFIISFTEPWWLDRRLRLQLDAYRTQRDQDEYDNTTTGLGASVTRAWLNNWRQTFGIKAERVELHSFKTGASAVLLAEEGSYNTNALSLSISKDTRDSYLNPTVGSRMILSAALQSEAIGSYSNILNLNAKGTFYRPVFKQSVLKLEAEIGYVDNFSGDPVAIFDRYFMGGTSSMRGFKRRVVSPVDINEDPLGGQSLLRGTVEIIYPIYRVLRGTLFCDAGNVWKGATDWDPSDLNISLGAGLHLDLPIGPVRIEFGVPVVTQQKHLSSSGRLHFNLGTSF